MSCIRLLRRTSITKEAAQVVGIRGFAVAGGKSKKGSKGGGGGDAPTASELSKELKSTTVFGANILKDGADPKIMPDSDYPDWLWHLLDKHLPLSELRRKDTETLTFDDLKRFVKLDNRARIKENNALRAKN
ncbi:54S ribosomal protein L37, mitochondrial [Cocos nucifera]|uniref:Large ribosomal subunit protein mL54 n=1 Tax=Cocos nucifera TaxID=13894 RepID=A0A8K0I660_COCNU|nr:54S ribosomal protein L37, mitochondrial [Cocos nucifera]